MSNGSGYRAWGSGEHARRLHVVIIAVWVLIAVGGCAQNKGSAMSSAQAPVAKSAPIQAADSCANRLQDLSGLLLMYSLSHSDLPTSLDELRSEPGFEDVKEFICPVSNRPYIYNPDGLLYESGYLVVYDATPAHSGMRWAIELTRPTGNQPMLTKVIAVKESFFSAMKN